MPRHAPPYIIIAPRAAQQILISNTILTVSNYPSPDSIRQDIAQNLDLAFNHFLTRPANGFPPLDASLKVENTLNILRELVAQALVILKREVIQLTSTRFSKCDGPTRDVMSLAERNLDVNVVRYLLLEGNDSL